MDVNYQIDLLKHTKAPKHQQLPVERSTAGRLKIQVYNTDVAFEALSSMWSDLSERTRGHVYTSTEWMECWWRHFGKSNQRVLFLITIWDLDEMIAIAPMYIGYSKLGPGVIERRLQMIGSGRCANEQFGYLDDYGISDFLDFLVDEAYEKEVAELLLNFFASNRYQIDKVILHQAGEESFIMKHLYPRLAKTGIHFDSEHTDTCPVINLEGLQSLSVYIKHIKSSNTRRRFRQTIRAIGTDNGFDVEKVDSSKELDTAVERLITLHQERWNQIGFPGVFYDARFKDFFKEIVRTAYSNGWLLFKQARDESGICAMRMIVKYNDRYYDYISGFDYECPSSKYRPGIGLLLDLVEEAIDGNADQIQLLRGKEGYKYDFTSDDVKNWKLTIYPGNKKNGIAAVLRYPLKLAAILYKHTSREFRLLNVQYRQRGLLKMLWAYMKFRAYSLRQKI